MTEVTDSKETEKKKSSSAGIIICLVSLGLLIAAGVILFIVGTGPARNFRKMNTDALSCHSNKDYEGAVEVYQKMLEIAPGNTNALNGLDRAYRMWADYLDDDNEPELSAEVMEDEAAYLADLNERVHSKKISRLIQDVEQRAEDYLNDDVTDPFGDIDPDDPDQQRPDGDPTVVLEAADKYMSVGDYNDMLFVDGSEEADALVQLMKDRGQDIFIFGDDYSGEKDYTGQAMGLYIVPDGYYFFYGDYVDGVRSGYGTCYWKNGEGTYEMYQGYWADDKPNGEGTITHRDENADTTTLITGNFTDGLQDGNMSYDVLDSIGTINHGEYTATMGDAPEIKVSYNPYEDYYDGYRPYVELTDGTVMYYDTNSEYLGVLSFRRR